MKSLVSADSKQLNKTVDYSSTFKTNQVSFPTISHRYSNQYCQIRDSQYLPSPDINRRKNSLIMHYKKENDEKKFSISKMLEQQSKNHKQKLTLLAQKFRQKLNTMSSKSKSKQHQFTLKIPSYQISPRKCIKKFKQRQNQQKPFIIEKKNIQNTTYVEYEKEKFKQARIREKQQKKLKQAKNIIEEKRIQFIKKINERKQKLDYKFDTQLQNTNNPYHHFKKQRKNKKAKNGELPLQHDQQNQLRPWTNHLLYQ